MDQPKRIQMRRTKGWRKPPNAIYVGRPTKWGNPFRIEPNVGIQVRDRFACDSARSAVAEYRKWLHRDADGRAIAVAARNELRGKDLACWCKPGQPCHADVLIEVANPKGKP